MTIVVALLIVATLLIFLVVATIATAPVLIRQGRQ